MLLFLQTEEEENWKTKVTVCYRQSWGGQYSARVTEVQMKFLFFFFSDELLLRQCVKGPWTRKAAADPQYRGGPLSCYVPEVDPLLKIRCCTSSMSRLRRYRIKPQPSLLPLLLLLLLLSLLLSRLTLLFFFFFLRLLLQSLL